MNPFIVQLDIIWEAIFSAYKNIMYNVQLYTLLYTVNVPINAHYLINAPLNIRKNKNAQSLINAPTKGEFIGYSRNKQKTSD